jgi:hypothetical protein
LALRNGCVPGERSEVECYWCGKIGFVDWRYMTIRGTPTSWPEFSLSIDHLQPVARGGSNIAENLVFACLLCNMCKGVRTADEYEAVLA